MTAAEATEAWVRDFVVRHGLCPFAARPLLAGRVVFVASSARDFEPAYDFARSQVQKILGNGNIETSLLIYPDTFQDFENFLDLVATLEDALTASGVGEAIQLAHFHPRYTFAGVAREDPGNRTNRSPFPTIQLLRTDSVAKAVATYPDIEKIPERNIAYLADFDGAPQDPR